MLTFPIDLVLSVAVGATVAFASRTTAGEYRLWRSPGLWSLLGFEALVFAPVGGYTLWRFPAWSLMYLVESDAVPFPPAYLALVYPVVAVSAYLACRRSLARGGVVFTATVAAGSLLLVVAIGFYGRHQLSVLGSTAAFRSDPESMRTAVGSTLAWMGVPALIGVAVAWGATLWRLSLLCRVSRSDALEVAAGEVGTDKKARRRGTKKKGA
jgi:hypothetical protein